MTTINYHHETILLNLPADQMAKLAEQGHGGVIFDMQATSGGKYVFAAYSGQDPSIAVGFLVETDVPKMLRRFFLCPIAHNFSAPQDADLHPLGIVFHPDQVMAIYEVTAKAVTFDMN